MATEAVASAMPSIRPTATTDAPSVPTRNTGNRAWTISEEVSMSSDTKPSATTVRGSFLRTGRPADGSVIMRLLYSKDLYMCAYQADSQC